MRSLWTNLIRSVSSSHLGFNRRICCPLEQDLTSNIFSISISIWIGNGNSLKTGNKFSCRAPDGRSRCREDIKKIQKTQNFQLRSFFVNQIIIIFSLLTYFYCNEHFSPIVQNMKKLTNEKNVACQVKHNMGMMQK